MGNRLFEIWFIIQGPRFSIGNGPNNSQSEEGFDALKTVEENIRREQLRRKNCYKHLV